MNSVIVCGEGKERIISAQISKENNGDLRITVSAEEIGEGYEYADLFYDFFEADESDNGYYVISDLAGGRLVRFKETEREGEYKSENKALRLFGCVKNGKGYAGKVIGMSDEYNVMCSKKGGEYRYFLRFPLEGRKPYEDISVILHESHEPDFDYNSMAHWYRTLGFESGEIKPLKEKVKENEFVLYAADSINIRIRMCWKPAPSKVEEQTRENEPPIHVACTFGMVEELIDELKAAGVDKADICLVGWNKSGHDGRWPEMFPVEPLLGGEEGLKKLLAKAKSVGYKLNLHTNFTDAYSIAENFSEDIIIKKKDGSLSKNFTWSGGRMYDVAIKYFYNTFIENLKKTAKLGFEGMHYVDVISAISPRRSYDAVYPMNPKEYTDTANNVLEKIKEIFGAASSEAGMDYVIKNLDYVLYGEFPNLWHLEKYNWMDEQIPLWFIVYHGSILYNADTKTINYSIKPKEKELRVIETGARPAAYCFVDFVEGMHNWGSEDIVWKQGESPKEAARVIAGMYKEYCSYKHLQYKFIKSHKYLDKGVSQICYDDGSTVTVDYNKGEYSIKKA